MEGGGGQARFWVLSPSGTAASCSLILLHLPLASVNVKLLLKPFHEKSTVEDPGRGAALEGEQGAEHCIRQNQEMSAKKWSLQKGQDKKRGSGDSP